MNVIPQTIVAAHQLNIVMFELHENTIKLSLKPMKKPKSSTSEGNNDKQRPLLAAELCRASPRTLARRKMRPTDKRVQHSLTTSASQFWMEAMIFNIAVNGFDLLDLKLNSPIKIMLYQTLISPHLLDTSVVEGLKRRCEFPSDDRGNVCCHAVQRSALFRITMFR